jgi:hypothetical protein
MALNFTGRQPHDRTEPPPSRAPVFLLACLGLAALLGGLVFALAVRQPRTPSAARPKPPAPLMATLVGVSEPSGAVFYPPAASPAPAAAPAPTPAPTPAPAPAPLPPPPVAAAPPPPSPAEIKARMLEVLRRAPHGAITLSVEDDAGAQVYARQLAALFREAGWTVSINSVFGAGEPMRGLSAALGSSPSDLAVGDAFASVGFPLGPPPSSAGVIETPELFVGVP